MLGVHIVATSIVDGTSLSGKPGWGRRGYVGAAQAHTVIPVYTHPLLNSDEGRILPVLSDTPTRAPDGGGVDRNIGFILTDTV